MCQQTISYQLLSTCMQKSDDVLLFVRSERSRSTIASLLTRTDSCAFGHINTRRRLDKELYARHCQRMFIQSARLLFSLRAAHQVLLNPLLFRIDKLLELRVV